LQFRYRGSRRESAVAQAFYVRPHERASKKPASSFESHAFWWFIIFAGFSLAGVMAGQLIGRSGDMAGSDILIGLIKLPTYYILQFSEVVFLMCYFMVLAMDALIHKMLTSIICSAVNGLWELLFFAALRLAWLRFHRHEDVA